MKSVAMLAAAAALSLVACGPQGSSREATNQEASAVPTQTNAPSAPPPAAKGAVAQPGIPPALHGRWALVPNDCTSTRGDAKGLLTIDVTTLRFYESRGILSTIAESAPTRLVADFAFSGEGMTWARRMELDAEPDGKVLIRREYGEDAAPGPLRYLRCPA